MPEPTTLHLTKMFMVEEWEQHQDSIRPYMHRELALNLMDFLVEHGPAIVGKVEEMSITQNSPNWGMVPMTEVRMRMHLQQIGPLEGEFYFSGGPADGQRIRTDGAAYWRIPVSGEPVTLSSIFDVDPSTSPGVLFATYVRRNTYYRFEGWGR